MPAFDQRWFEDYTPYFPGLSALETHEIFSPRYEHTRKIVFLGASSVDSIGCDYTWHHPTPDGSRNVHYSCSVAGQLNQLLDRAHIKNWRAFDLARNGGKMTGTLYVYSRIQALHPDVVVIGDSYNYFMWENADANALSADQYAYLDGLFGQTAQTARLWSSYRANLREHAWLPPPPATPVSDIAIGPRPRTSTSTMDLLARGLGLMHASHLPDGMPRPVAYDSGFKWMPPGRASVFVNPDPDFRYFQGVTLIADEQKRRGGKTMFFFAPQQRYVNDPVTIDGIQREYGGYLAANDVPFVSLIPMRMRPVSETYDGSHHTLYGNRRIAETLLRELTKNGVVN